MYPGRRALSALLALGWYVSRFQRFCRFAAMKCRDDKRLFWLKQLAPRKSLSKEHRTDRTDRSDPSDPSAITRKYDPSATKTIGSPRAFHCREAADALKARNIPAQGKQRRRRAPPWVTRSFCSCSSASLAPVGAADWGQRGNGASPFFCDVARFQRAWV